MSHNLLITRSSGKIVETGLYPDLPSVECYFCDNVIKLVLPDGLPDSHVASPDRSPENRKMFRHFEVRLRALC